MEHDFAGKVALVTGGSTGIGRAADTTEDEWRAVLDTNLTGVFLGATPGRVLIGP